MTNTHIAMYYSINSKMWRAMDHLQYVLLNQRQHIRYVLYFYHKISHNWHIYAIQTTTDRVLQSSYSHLYTYLPTYLPTYLHIYLPTYISSYISIYPSIYLLTCTYDRMKLLYYWVRHGWKENEEQLGIAWLDSTQWRWQSYMWK